MESPCRSWYVSKSGTNKNAIEVEQDLQAMMIDSDKDGLADIVETSTGAFENNPSCAKTNPNNKDSDGDGRRDGIEVDMK